MRLLKTVLFLGLVFNTVSLGFAASKRTVEHRTTEYRAEHPNSANSKFLHLGAMAGLHSNAYDSNPDVKFDSALSPVLGAYVEVPVIPQLSLLGQLSYAAYNGSYSVVAVGQTFNVKLESSYFDILAGVRGRPLEVPIVTPFIEAGANLGIRLSSDVEVTQSNGTKIQSGSTTAVSSTNFAMFVGVGGELTVLPIPVSVGFRYLHGLTDITKTTGEEWKTRAFQIYAGATVISF